MANRSVKLHRVSAGHYDVVGTDLQIDRLESSQGVRTMWFVYKVNPPHIAAETMYDRQELGGSGTLAGARRVAQMELESASAAKGY